MADTMLAAWIKAQKLRGPNMKNSPSFERNLEDALDARRVDHAMFTRNMSAWKLGQAVDFCSNDLLSLGATGQIREAFLEELAAHPNFNLYAGGSRLMDGNYHYIEEVEQEIADFHKAETALLVGSGYEANGAIYAAIPRPGDAIIYDELVHASTHDGMSHSLALFRLEFKHNDVESFRDTLISVMDTQPMIRDGLRSVLVSVESVYSMDGDVCPILELLEVAKEICPKGNVEFIVDEAHATGILGPNGAGLAQHHIQALVKHFFLAMVADPVWDEASEMGILSIPVIDAWESRDWLAHIVPVWTRQRYNFWLVFHLQLAGFGAFPIGFPTVPKGQERIRIMFHGSNTFAEVDGLAAAICAWAKEMIDIEKRGEKNGQVVPKAAQKVYALMATI
ncbi:putative secondary metabolism biosynthetic enzyme [Gnomoniopsis sp. IMI 355080]|nr:putative secondary metabolism biosynthetic enzyme [Gnomoniopsis sp. IMI 355080]